MNATHGSDSAASAMRELKFFFPNLTLDPVPEVTTKQNSWTRKPSKRMFWVQVAVFWVQCAVFWVQFAVFWVPCAVFWVQFAVFLVKPFVPSNLRTPKLANPRTPEPFEPSNPQTLKPYTLHPTPYTLHPTP
jgi:hypothetical protein